MKFSSLIFTASVFTSAVSAFAPSKKLSRSAAGSVATTTTTKGVSSAKSHRRSTAVSAFGAAAGSTINVADETAQRDVYGMENWAMQCGVQKANGVEIWSGDGNDWQMITNENIAAGTPVLFVPAGMVLSSNAVEQEFGGQLEAAENALVQMEQGLGQRLPLFRLMIKILAEYEKGEESPYYPWLNSLPRQFFNGVAMTDACFDCLPPYAAMLAMNERNAYSRFVNAIRQGYVPLQDSTMNNDAVVKWAYNVALTRFTEVWQPVRQKLIAPMADLFNHGADPNVEITFDNEGNCMVNSITDIPAGSALTISLGNPTNPTPLFAKYGFLPNDCATVFCKAIHLEPQIEELGYNFNDLVIQTQSGEIAPQVWDIFLYKILQDNDPNAAEQFFVACKTNDEESKQGAHAQYFPYTLDALKQHVGSILHDVEQLTNKAQSYDLRTHPRVPVIVAHNTLVRDTFLQTRNLLENMG
eukprot:scaffold8005_cov275-Amphora_coffeaeformis.AAC.14